MDNNFIQNLLTDMDDNLLWESVAEFDVPFDNEVLFQRSYAKFEAVAEHGKVSRLFFKCTTFRIMTAAACLLLTVGLSVGVWSRQQKIETRPPQEMQTTTATRIETHTETTVRITTESQTNFSNGDTTCWVTETTISQPEDVMTIHTTIVYTTAETAQEHVSTDTESTQYIAPLTTVMSTASTVKSQTYPVQTNPIQHIPANTISSISTGTAITSNVNQSSDTSNLITSIETSFTIPMLQSTSAPSTELAIASSTAITSTTKKAEFPDLEGYHIHWDTLETDQWRVSYTQTVEASPSALRTYEINSPYYQIIQEETSDETLFRQYHVQCIGQAKSFWLRQYHRNEFSFLCPPDSSLEASSNSGNPCVWVLSHDAYTLWWDDGCYLFCIFGEASDRTRMAEVAECFMKEEEIIM